MKLILSSSTVSDEPYTFNLTGIKVYSIEEALWHILNYIDQSVGVVGDDAFFLWLKNKQGLPQQAEILRNADTVVAHSRLIDFLSAFDYVSREEIQKTAKRLDELSQTGSFDRQKEAGDRLYRLGKYQQAVDMYAAAVKLEPEKDSVISNNIGLCCMQYGDYENAVLLFERSFYASNNQVVLLNLVEAYIMNEQLAQAGMLIEKYSGEDLARFLLLNGFYAVKKGEYEAGIYFYKESFKIEPNSDVIIDISDIYIKKRRFQEAIQLLEECNIKEAVIFERLAKLHCENRNYTAAVRTIQRGLVYFMQNIGLWITLARCYRLALDFSKADAAICKALSIDGENEEANLELARIRKGEGKIYEYRKGLEKCLDILKYKYLRGDEKV